MASSGSTATPFYFAGGHGYQSDAASGLMLLGARYYDPSVGRFISRDPIRYDGGVNLYGYCGNDPVDAVDPLGQSFWPSFGKGFIAGALGAIVVVGIAAIVVMVGVPAAVVTGGLFVVGAIGAGAAIWGVIRDPSADNVGYTLGSFVGSAVVGGLTGGKLARALSPPEHQPAPGLGGFNPIRDAKQVWKPFPLAIFKNFPTAMGTGPNPLSGAGAVSAGGGGGAATGHQEGLW